MSMIKQIKTTALVVLLLLSLSASAQTLLSNLSNTSNGAYAGAPDSADHFTTGTSALTVTDVDVAWAAAGTAGINQVGIYTDAGGFPSGTLVGSFFTNANVTAIGTMTYSGNAALSANTTYWMVVDITDNAGVSFTFDGAFVADASTGGAVILDRSAYGDNLAVTWTDDPGNLQFALISNNIGPPAIIPGLNGLSLILLMASLLVLVYFRSYKSLRK